MTDNIDTLLEDADWLRAGTFDFGSVNEFLNAVTEPGSTKEEQKASVARFMRLPSARSMPEKFKAALRLRGLLD